MFFFHDFKAVLAPRLHRSLTRPPLMDAYVRKRAQLTDFATKKKKANTTRSKKSVGYKGDEPNEVAYQNVTSSIDTHTHKRECTRHKKEEKARGLGVYKIVDK